MIKWSGVGYRKRMGCVTLFLTTIINYIIVSECEVGITSSSGFMVNIVMKMVEFHCNDRGVIFGPATNVLYNKEYSYHLCNFLKRKRTEFMSIREQWLVHHNTFTKSITWFNFFRKIYNKWFVAAPHFYITISIDYLNLVDIDEFNSPLTWCKASIRYISPVGSSGGYDLFKNSDESFPFSVDIVLSPDFTPENSILSYAESYLYPVLDIIALRNNDFRTDVKNNTSTTNSIAVGAILVYSHFSRHFTLSFSLADIWQSLSRCYISDGRFYTEETLFTDNKSLCQWAHDLRYKNVVSMLQGKFSNNVELRITSANFFEGDKVVICGLIHEGYFLRETYQNLQCFNLDSNPNVRQRKEIASKYDNIKTAVLGVTDIVDALKNRTTTSTTAPSTHYFRAPVHTPYNDAPRYTDAPPAYTDIYPYTDRPPPYNDQAR